MKWSSRKAGVLMGCKMQYHGARLRLIPFAIVFVLSTSTVSGFIIRKQEIGVSTTDMNTEGSSLREAWSDLNTLNKTKLNENLSDKVIALNNIEKTTKVFEKEKESDEGQKVALKLIENLHSNANSSKYINGTWDVKNHLNGTTTENIKSFKNNLTAVDIAGIGNRSIKINNDKDTSSTQPNVASIKDLGEFQIKTTESTTNNINAETSTELNDKTVSSVDGTDYPPSSVLTEQGITLESVAITTPLEFSKDTKTFLATTESQTVESFNTDIATDATITMSYPPWKNYETINRHPAISEKEIEAETTTSEPKYMKTESITNPTENTSIFSLDTHGDNYFNITNTHNYFNNKITVSAITEDGVRELESSTPSTNSDISVSDLYPKATSGDKLISNVHLKPTISSLENATFETSTQDSSLTTVRDSKLEEILENVLTDALNQVATMTTLDTQFSKSDINPKNSNTLKPVVDTTLPYLNTETSILDTTTTHMDTEAANSKVTLASESYSTPANLDTTEMFTLNDITENLNTQITTHDSRRDELTAKFDRKMAKLRAELQKFATPKLDTESTEKLEVVSSKRAGYLDNSETTTPGLNSEHGTTAIIMNNYQDTRDSFATMYGGETNYGELNESLENKKLKNATLASQRQLTEDAILEEFLMEKQLNDKIPPKDSWQLTNDNYSSSPPTNDNSLSELTNDNTAPPPTNDNNSSLPINDNSFSITTSSYTLNGTNGTEKRNISTIYTPSPNYKPAKKLDVQHLKQFVRDPDDNSWRNESISSLGIVFKPKNASKSFTEVLKNKTTELNSITKQDNKTNVPVLRYRLEKMAELRKSKKKKNDSSEGLYGDYDDIMFGDVNSSNEEWSSAITVQPTSNTKDGSNLNDVYTAKVNIFEEHSQKPTKNTTSDYYDPTDEYDYPIIPKMELKRFKTKVNVTVRPSNPYTTRRTEIPTTPLSTYPPNRQATVQYFPPTKKVTEKVVLNEYDDSFNMRINQYRDMETVVPTTAATTPTTPQNQPTRLDKNVSLKSQTQKISKESTPEIFLNANKASYIIRHYKDFINNAAKDSDDDRVEYMPFTERPAYPGMISAKLYNIENEGQSDKSFMDRFVDNFNRNSERFKVDFPILYNTSVIHRKEDDGHGRVLASSSAFYKRLYESAQPRSNVIVSRNPCASNCDNINVDLSPAYELHYYVPEQEETEELSPHQADTELNRYRL